MSGTTGWFQPDPVAAHRQFRDLLEPPQVAGDV